MNLDGNRDQIIQVDELKPLLIQIGYGNLDEEGIQKIIDIFDENGDGEMDFIEFIDFFSYICKTLVKRNPKAAYRQFLDTKKFSYFSKPQTHKFDFVKI